MGTKPFFSERPFRKPSFVSSHNGGVGLARGGLGRFVSRRQMRRVLKRTLPGSAQALPISVSLPTFAKLKKKERKRRQKSISEVKWGNVSWIYGRNQRGGVLLYWKIWLSIFLHLWPILLSIRHEYQGIREVMIYFFNWALPTRVIMENKYRISEERGAFIQLQLELSKQMGELCLRLSTLISIISKY